MLAERKSTARSLCDVIGWTPSGFHCYPAGGDGAGNWQALRRSMASIPPPSPDRDRANRRLALSAFPALPPRFVVILYPVSQQFWSGGPTGRHADVGLLPDPFRPRRDWAID